MSLGVNKNKMRYSIEINQNNLYYILSKYNCLKFVL